MSVLSSSSNSISFSTTPSSASIKLKTNIRSTPPRSAAILICFCFLPRRERLGPGEAAHQEKRSTPTGFSVQMANAPVDLYVSSREAGIALRSIKLRKQRGPDGIPRIIFRTFSFELASVIIAAIYHASLREGYLPPLLKSAASNPISTTKSYRY